MKGEILGQQNKPTGKADKGNHKQPVYQGDR